MLKFETNIGHVEMLLRIDELSIEHQLEVSGKQYTMRINMDSKQTKQILKMLKILEMNKIQK